MLREILYGLCGNFIFSLCLYTYKKYNHKHYDEIITRLKQLERMNNEYNNINTEEIISRLKRIEQCNDIQTINTRNKNSQQFLIEHKDKVGYFTDDKYENIKWLPKEDYYKK